MTTQAEITPLEPETIKDQKIPESVDTTLRDASGNVIADQTGLNPANFGNNYYGSGTFSGQTFITEADMANTTFTFTLIRPALVLINFSSCCYMTPNSGTYYAGYGHIYLNIDGSNDRSIFLAGSKTSGSPTEYSGIGDNALAASLSHVIPFAKGDHTIKMRAKCEQLSGDPKLYFYNYTFNYIIFGR